MTFTTNTSRRSLKQRIATLCLATAGIAMPLVAQAATITGQWTADNYLRVTYGTQSTTVPVASLNGNEGDWRRLSDYSFTIPDSMLMDKSCRVQVVAWGDRSQQAGLAGYFSGPDGTVFSGGPNIRGITTSTPASGTTPPPVGTMEVWRIGSHGSVNTTGTVATQGPWNFAGLNFGGPGNNTIRWIWTPGAPNAYRSFVIPCTALARPVVVEEKPEDMRGEHFQCYPVRAEKQEEVELRVEDQFGEGSIVIGRPVVHCNPSAKQHNRRYYDIQDKERHLVCYDILKQTPVRNRKVGINNQIGPQTYVTPQQRSMFCVPSSKKEL